MGEGAAAPLPPPFNPLLFVVQLKCKICVYERRTPHYYLTKFLRRVSSLATFTNTDQTGHQRL